MRQIKGALIARGISMPDEAREVIFPQGVRVFGGEEAGRQAAPAAPPRPHGASRAAEDASTVGAGLENEDILCEEEAPDLAETRENLLPEAGRRGEGGGGACGDAEQRSRSRQRWSRRAEMCFGRSWKIDIRSRASPTNFFAQFFNRW